MIKASAGGGGKGIRLVRSAEEIENAVRVASSEAQSAFGDGGVFLERYLSPVRHVEIQVLGDKHGNVVALGERECSRAAPPPEAARRVALAACSSRRRARR